MESRTVMTLDDLPEECVLQTIGVLESFRDVLCLQQSCKRLNCLTRSHTVWLPLLKRDFDLRLESVEGAEVDWPALYREAAQKHNPRNLRYYGCYTDGGCDDNLAQYWVDNMFVPKHWNSYCSAAGANVNCIGLLLDGPALNETQEGEHRRYMIERCKWPATVLFGGPEALRTGSASPQAHVLEQWSTAELEYFLINLFGEYEQGRALGKLLLTDVSIAETPVQEQRLRTVVNRLRETVDVTRIGVLSPPNNRNQLFDTRVLPSLAPRERQQTVGIIQKVTICRAGDFSCPVLCGALFVATTPPALGSGKDGDLPATVQLLDSVSKEVCCHTFDDLTHKQAVYDEAEEGRLPRVIASGSFTGGEWLEFDPTYDPPALSDGCGKQQVLRPMLWFRFYTREEVKQMAQSRRQARARRSMDGQVHARHAGASTPQPPSSAAAVGQPGRSAATASSAHHPTQGASHLLAAPSAPAPLLSHELPRGQRMPLADVPRVLLGLMPSTSAAQSHAPNGATAGNVPTDGAGPSSSRNVAVHSSVYGALQAASEADAQSDAAGPFAGAGPSSYPPAARSQPLAHHPGAAGPTSSGSSVSPASHAGTSAGHNSQHTAALVPQAMTAVLHRQPASRETNSAAPYGPQYTSQATAAGRDNTHPTNMAQVQPMQVSSDESDWQDGWHDDDDDSSDEGSSDEEMGGQGMEDGDGADGPQVLLHMLAQLGNMRRIRATEGMSKLDISLSQRHSGNMVCVKLICPEDLMELWEDQHDHVNIDVNYVAFNGAKVTLPSGVRLREC